MKRLLALLIVLAGCGGPSKTAATGPSVAPVPTAPAPEGLRLPDHIAPTAYQLELELDPTSNEFRGRVAIDLDIHEPISSLWLNGVDLVLRDAYLTVGKRRIELTELAPPKGAEVIGFDLGETIGAGRARLTVEYTGAVRQRTGVFRQTVGDEWYAFTDFEPTDARRAFPCFDDPRHKVPWTIELVVDEKLEAFANTPVTGVAELDDGRKRVSFAKTRPMPSYLVAFAAGPFEVVEGATKPVPIRAIVPKGRAADAAYALAAAPEMLAWLQDYFGTPVPYDKVDFISVPEMSGAMENPGLITVGERILLVDPKRGSLGQRRLLAMVIAHELAHLWFGDYVTLSWWNDLWLNEGFATWMADKVVSAWKPDWRWELEVVDNKVEAMEVDSQPDASPIRASIESLDDIHDAFGPITYKKGGAVLGMFEAWIGEEPFRDGVRAYIAKHADGTAEAADLLDALSKASGRDVRAAFNSFLEEPGVPTMVPTLKCDAGGARVEVRFDGSARWQVPMCVRSSHGQACGLVGPSQPTEIPLAKTGCPAWFHPNAKESGYYRYLLDDRAMDALRSAGLPSLSGAERLGLASNVRARLQVGAAPRKLGPVLEPLEALAGDDRAAVVRQVVAAVADLRIAARGKKSRAAYAAYVRDLFAERARALGFARAAGESDDDAQLRPLLLGFVGDAGEDTKLRAEAAKLATAWLADSSAVAPDVVEIAMRLAAIDGDAKLFDALLEALESADDDTRREPIIVALGSFANPKLTERVLKLGFEDKTIGQRDAVGILRVALENLHTRDVAFDYLRANYVAVSKRIPPQLEPFVPLLAAGFCTAKRAEQIEALFGPGAERNAQSRRVLDLALREVNECDAFRARHQDGAEAFFR